MTDISLETISNRIRYESISKLADAVGKANSIEEIELSLQQNIKYIVSAYSYLFCIQVENQILEFGVKSDFPLRKNILAQQLDNIQERPEIYKNSDAPSKEPVVSELFKNDKNKSVLKVSYKSKSRSFIAYCGTKEDIGYSISDIKFVKLICEIVSPKVQTILLTHKISQRNIELNSAFLKIQNANKEVNNSIDYATMVQSALLPSSKSIKNIFENNFVFFQPRHKVSGDFYYSFQHNDYKLIIAADCTGHGVPGALLSIFGIQILREVCRNVPDLKPDEILEQLDQKFHEYLLHGVSDTESVIMNDGIDIAVVTVNYNTQDLWFSSAYRSLVYFDKNEELTRIKGARFPIGSKNQYFNKSFKLHNIKFSKNDRFCIFSDGYSDQFGGPNDKKYGSKRLTKTLSEIQKLPFKEHKTVLVDEFNNWIGDTEQIDDILFIGIEL